MAKNKVSEWSATPANNTDIANIDIAEGCAPSGINNAIREIMAQVKDMQTGADGDDFNVGGDLTVTDDAVIGDRLIVMNAAEIEGTLRTTGRHFANGGVTGNLTGDVTGNVSGTSANVTGTVAVANGGTGLTTLTANNVMLGNGTSTPAFVAPGTSGNVLVSNGTTWVSGTAGIGTDQTWTDVTGSRTSGTTYTNTTGKPIVISAHTNGVSGAVPTGFATVDGIVVVRYVFIAPLASYPALNYFLIVPNNSTYSISIANTSFNVWAELR
jgi:hypothetical protein